MNFIGRLKELPLSIFLKRELILADQQKAILSGKIANLTAENSLLAAKAATLEEENANLKLLLEQYKQRMTP